MGAMMQRTNASEPCVLCGSYGYDIRVVFDGGDIVHYCHKSYIRDGIKKGEVIGGKDGKEYICIAENATLEKLGAGQFHKFKEYLSKEEYLNRRKMQPTSVVQRDPNALIKGECKRLSHAEMDVRLKYFLSLLILEDKDRKSFEREWKMDNGIDVMHLLNDYPIRSLPMPDKTRFAYGIKTKNPTRKQVVKAMLDKFGDLRGMPGFYLRGGKYYEGKPEAERWTFGGEGVIFPCYDAEGLLYSIRLKDAYPAKEVREGRDEPFNNMYGTFSHSYDADGFHQWKFTSIEGGEPVLVFGRGVNMVELNSDFLPVYGKVTNKYKNFSSFFERRGADGEIYNALDQGARSGSPFSVYNANSRAERGKYCIITEGEKKGMVANTIMGMKTVVVPGVWSYRSLFQREDGKLSTMEMLMQQGVKSCIVCYDADKYTNEDVRKAEAALVADLKANGMVPLIGDWSNKLEKGLDDLLMQGIIFNLVIA